MVQKKLQEDRYDCRFIHLERVERAHQHGLPLQENQHIAGLFKTMGDPNRLRILWALGQEEMCVCDVALFLNVSESAVSHQLRLLRTLSLISRQMLHYRVTTATIRPLIELGISHIREAD